MSNLARNLSVETLSDEILKATQTIDPVFLHSPQFHCDALESELGLRLTCKIETINPIRSFKGRGADYFVKQLPHETKQLVCASAGNFGQGLAYAARQQRISLDVFAAKTANPFKVERMRELGARVHLSGKDFDEAKDAAKAYALRNKIRYVEDGREQAISAGAGTIAAELLRDSENYDAVVVPLGNGALINGIGAWFKTHSPSTRVIGVCMNGAPAMEQSWRAQKIIQTNNTRTIADGIAVRVPVPEALQIMQATVDDIWLVDDEDLLTAMRLAHKKLGIVTEPAGVAGLAAITKACDQLAGQSIATIFCGGNLTEEQRRLWLY